MKIRFIKDELDSEVYIMYVRSSTNSENLYCIGTIHEDILRFDENIRDYMRALNDKNDDIELALVLPWHVWED